MDKVFPDKWIRKAIFGRLNNLDVNGELIKCYDTRLTSPDIADNYIIMSTQTATVDKNNKCEWFWNSSILLDVFTSYSRSGNPGSRLGVDDIMNLVRQETNDLVLEGGLSIITQTQSFPNDITAVTDNEVVQRKFLRLELLIK